LSSRTITEIQSSTTWANTVSIEPNSWNSPFNGDNLNSTFDSTDIVSGNRAVHAMTFRFIASENFEFRQDSFRDEFEYLDTTSGGFTQHSPFFVYINDADTQFVPVINPKLGRHISSGDLAFQVDWGNYDYVRFTGLDWDDLADRWITVVAAASSNQSDFANHNPPQGFGNLYMRVTITDARTGLLIQSIDARVNQFQLAFSDFADRTWRYRDSSGDSATAWLLTQIRGADEGFFDESAVLTAAGWSAIGQMIDPLSTIDGRPAYQWFVGQNFPETVGGVRAWINFSAKEVTTDSGDVSVFEIRPGRVATELNTWSIKEDTSVSTPYSSTDKP
jgi:hypothetical protein